jgi:hypothetical protein
MVEKVILLGFEQDIYLPDEYAGMYLFLGLIATRRKELLRRVEAHYIVLSSSLLKERRFREVQDVEDAQPFLASLIAGAEGTAELALAMARFYIVALYLGKLPMPRRTPFSTDKLRYEVRMKPFLALSPPEAPPFEDFQAHSQPYGPPPPSLADSPPEAFVRDVRDGESSLWKEVDTHLKAAKAAFTEYKKLGAEAAKAKGVEASWSEEVKSLLASCVSLGLAVKGIKDAVLAGDEGGEEVGKRIKIEIPEAGAGKRYAEGWIVGKVSRV